MRYMAILKGRTKVMVNSAGIPKIQEELDGNIRVFSVDQWAKELKKRAKAALADDKKSEGAPKRGRGRPPKNSTSADGDDDKGSLIQEDVEDSDDGVDSDIDKQSDNDSN